MLPKITAEYNFGQFHTSIRVAVWQFLAANFAVSIGKYPDVSGSEYGGQGPGHGRGSGGLVVYLLEKYWSDRDIRGVQIRLIADASHKVSRCQSDCNYEGLAQPTGKVTHQLGTRL